MSILAQGALVAKIFALLHAASTLRGVMVYRNRLRPLGVNSPGAIVVRKLGSDPVGQPQFGAGRDWETQIRVECYARASAAETAHEPCDDLLLAAHDVLSRNPTLDGLAIELSDPRIAWDEDENDASVAVAIAQYTITHRTAHRSLLSAS